MAGLVPATQKRGGEELIQGVYAAPLHKPPRIWIPGTRPQEPVDRAEKLLPGRAVRLGLALSPPSSSARRASGDAGDPWCARRAAEGHLWLRHSGFLGLRKR